MTGSAAFADDLDFEVEVEGWLDLRTSLGSGETGFLDGGLGKSRYGKSEAGGDIVRGVPADAALVLKPKFGFTVDGFIHLGFAPEQDKPADVIEAFLRYKPVPTGEWRFEGRAGLFFPPISLENTDRAWASPFSITPSAINSWVGEEVRALGTELSLSRRFGSVRARLRGSVFGGNDTAGALLAWRGWALHDYKVGAFTGLTLPEIPALADDGFFFLQADFTEPVIEVDDNPGYYTSLELDLTARLHVRAMWYDNLGTPELIENGQYSWKTTFWHFGAQWRPTDEITLISQFMNGRTVMGELNNGVRQLDDDFRSGFFLASYAKNAFRISARLDLFEVFDKTFVAEDNNNEDGTAITVSASYDLDRRWRLMAEWLHIDSDRAARVYFSDPTRLQQDTWQLSLRARF